MQQMNLFNTSPEVAGFKLDYLEVWNWGAYSGGYPFSISGDIRSVPS